MEERLIVSILLSKMAANLEAMGIVLYKRDCIWHIYIYLPNSCYLISYQKEISEKHLIVGHFAIQDGRQYGRH